MTGDKGSARVPQTQRNKRRKREGETISERGKEKMVVRKKR